MLSLIRYSSEDLNLQLWANDANVLTHWNSHGVLHSVLTIHIPFVIGALYRHQTNRIGYDFNERTTVKLIGRSLSLSCLIKIPRLFFTVL